MCMLNAYNMYMTRTGKEVFSWEFSERMSLLKSWIDLLYSCLSVHVPGDRAMASLESLAHLNVVELETHYPVHVPPPPLKPQNKGQRECTVCKTTVRREKKCKLVTTMCNGCNVGLWIGGCFRQYHSLMTFQVQNKKVKIKYTEVHGKMTWGSSLLSTQCSTPDVG